MNRQIRRAPFLATLFTLRQSILGIDMPIRTYAEKIKAALKAEGVQLGHAEFVIPAMTLFQEKEDMAKAALGTADTITAT